MNTEHIMVDIETLGTRHNAVVLSIGAVKFDHRKIHEDNGLYLNLTWQDQIDMGGTVTEGTLRFWLKQPSAPREALFNKKGESTAKALQTFEKWFRKNVKAPRDCNVWAMPPSFDLGLLGDLFRRFQKGEPPWPFWAERDVRTARMMAGVNTIKRASDSVEHHAFDDAVHQAKLVRKFLIACGGPATKPKKDTTPKPKNEPLDDDLLS